MLLLNLKSTLFYSVLVHSFSIFSLTFLFWFKIANDFKFVVFFCPFISGSGLMTTEPALLTHRTLVSLMQVINGVQFLNITFLFLLFGDAAVPVFATVLVPLTCMYASLQSHNFDLIIEVLLNLIWLLTLYVSRYSSFISTQFFVLNFDFWFVISSNKFIIFWYSIIILYIIFILI